MPQQNSIAALERYLIGLSKLGRPDAYAVRWEGANGSSGYKPERKPVNIAVIKRHLAGQPSIGIYFPVGSYTRFAVLDADNHKSELTIDEVIARIRPIAQALEKAGMVPRVNISGGGKGIHIWLIWEKPQPAHAVRKFLEQILMECGFVSGSGSVMGKVVEIFPKQNRIDPEGFGNPIALPISRKSVFLDRDFRTIQSGAFVFPSISEIYSQPVTVSDESDADEEGPPVSKLPGDESQVQAALKHIPATSYEIWIKMGLALKHVFGEDGFSIWHGWSKSGGSAYTGELDCRARWDGFSPTGKIGLGTIFHLAKAGGWNGPSDEVIREMNARFAVLNHSNKTLIIVKNGDLLPDDNFVTLAKPVFLDRLKGEWVANGRDKTEKSKYWLSHPLREHYYALDFDPEKPPGGNGRRWNLWTGFSVKPEKGDWSLLQIHILENICRGSEEKYEWLLNWMALGVQKPGQVIGTAPVLIGMPGTGKGVLAHAYGRLWGQHFIAITHHEHVSGRFNAHLVAKRFAFIDEGTFGGDRKQAGVIKTRVTESTITLEQKGVDPIRFRNRMIFMIASNEASVVPADIGDRRWMIFDVGDGKREDQKYFGAIQDQMDSGGYEAMLHELQNRKFDVGPNPKKIIKSTALFEQIIRAQPPDIKYIYHILDTGRLPQNLVAGASATTIKALWTELQSSQPEAKWITLESLGRTIREIFAGIKSRTNGKYVASYTSAGPIHELSTQYNFPELAFCRRQFESYLGCPIPWSKDVKEWSTDPVSDFGDII